MENKNTPAEVLTTAPVRKLVRAFITGFLVRDVDPKPEDLKSRAKQLAKGCPAATVIELRAIYLPLGSIPTLTKKVLSKKGGAK